MDWSFIYGCIVQRLIENWPYIGSIPSLYLIEEAFWYILVWTEPMVLYLKSNINTKLFSFYYYTLFTGFPWILISSSCKCPKVLAIASFHMSLESKHSAVKTPFAGIFEYLKWIHIFSKTMPQMKTILRYMYQGMYFSETTKPYLEEILFFQ